MDELNEEVKKELTTNSFPGSLLCRIYFDYLKINNMKKTTKKKNDVRKLCILKFPLKVKNEFIMQS